MTIHYLHHGGAGVRNPNWEMYPAAKPVAGVQLRPAAHKEPIAFGITRLLDFSQKDGRRQAGLQQYLERAANDGTPLQAGDTCTLSCVPARSLLLGYAWGVEVPEQGVSFDITLAQKGETLASGISGAAEGSNAELLDKPLWLPDGDVLAVTFNGFPAKGATDLTFWVTPIVIVPKIGN
ncbi:hypothetical protein [Dyella sp.]|uniref:hypothetical protein n=1 Tax=Dyella sp. TaxID=1869338 RepID=UPI002FDB0568